MKACGVLMALAITASFALAGCKSTHPGTPTSPHSVTPLTSSSVASPTASQPPSTSAAPSGPGPSAAQPYIPSPANPTPPPQPTPTISPGVANTTSTATGGACSIRANTGNCYNAGEFCRPSDVGKSTTDAAGRAITCGYESGSRPHWHY